MANTWPNPADLPTTSLDNDADPTTGPTGGRQQLLDAVNRLNLLLKAGDDGATLWSDANDQPLARQDLANIFTAVNTFQLPASGTTIYLQLRDSASGNGFNISLGDQGATFRIVNPAPTGGGTNTPILIDSDALQLLMNENGVYYNGNAIAYKSELPPRGYSCLVENNGAATRLPPGWTAARVSPGKYRITHNLGVGTNNYSANGNAFLNTASPWNPGVLVQVLNTNYVEYSTRDSSGNSIDAAAVITIYEG